MQLLQLLQELLLALLLLLHHLEVNPLPGSKGTCPKVLDDCLVMNNSCLPVDIFVQSAAGAGLVGTKMARRTGSVDEFEFKAIGDNHNQGVCLCFIHFSHLAHPLLRLSSLCTEPTLYLSLKFFISD